jgi:hypothetical protein
MAPILHQDQFLKKDQLSSCEKGKNGMTPMEKASTKG